jgi:hypothetical protein
MSRPDTPDPRTALRDWVAARNDEVTATEDLDRVALFEQRVLTSLHLPELILLIERLTGAPVDATALRAEDIHSIDAIVAAWFSPEPVR